jgi:hypothetical protein
MQSQKLEKARAGISRTMPQPRNLSKGFYALTPIQSLVLAIEKKRITACST